MINWGKTFENSFFLRLLMRYLVNLLKNYLHISLEDFLKKNLAKGNF